MINQQIPERTNLFNTFWKGKKVLPRFFNAHLSFPSIHLENVEKTISETLDSAPYFSRIHSGQNIAIAIGSRGIAELPLIVKSLVEKIRQAGCCPFIVPAMGSHGQSTGAGQKEILRSLDITAASVNAPIQSSMSVRYLGKTSKGVSVYIDRHAYNADGIIVINRVREHTDFNGPIQSGLMKMLAIGLGKAFGASALHARGANELHIHIPEVGQYILDHAPIALGIAVVENGTNELASVQCAEPDQFETTDKFMLQLARKLTPRLPLDRLDVLVVHQIGKDLSGSGMDTKTIGRIRIPGVPEPEAPCISRIVALDLTNASHGNATGIYLADIITQRLLNKIDYSSYYLNQLASAHLEGGKIPIALSSEQEAIEVAMCLGWRYNTKNLRVAIIQDTKHLFQMAVSESLVGELSTHANIQVEGESYDLRFDHHGNLINLPWQTIS